MTTRESYIQFMRNKGLSSRTIEKYAYQVPDNFYVQNVFSRLAGTKNMYGVTSRAILRAASAEIKSMAFDEIGHGMYSAGINKYIQFLNSL